MYRRSRVRLVVATLVALALSLPATITGFATPPDHAGGPDRERLIVVFNDSVGNPAAAANQISSQHNGQIGFVYEHALKGFSVSVPPQAADAISRNPQVAYVERDQAVFAFDEVPTGVDRSEVDKNGTAGIDGSGGDVDVDIAIIDTGIDASHPDLNVHSSIDCTQGWWFLPMCSDTGDDGNGHGTHVAGTAAALDNGQGVVGVAPGARLWAVKVLDDSGSGSISQIVAGIDYVTSHAGEIEVANMSLGCECSSAALDDAISASTDAGIVYAVAAGNNGTNASTFSPASHPEVIAVSAMADFDGLAGGVASPTCRSDVGGDDEFATFSNYGSVVDLAAPGVCINSTWPGGGYNSISGTSMASPHGAGAAALYIVENGIGKSSSTWSQVRNGLRSDWAVAQNDTDDSDGISWAKCGFTGAKSNEPFLMLAACDTASDGEPTDSPPSVSITSPADGATVSNSVTVTADAGDDDAVTQVEFFVDGDSVGVDSDGNDGWSTAWDTTTVVDGEHTVTAEATDTVDQTTSTSITVTVDNVPEDNPPTVTITNPSDGATVSGVVAVTADADDDNGINRIEFFDGLTNIGVDSDGSDGWSVDWDTTGAVDGDHILTAVVVDTADQTATDSVTVTVENSTGSATTMHVGDLDGSSVNNGRTWLAEVTITVHDTDHDPVANAMVLGVWSDGSTLIVSCTTDSSGQCTVDNGGGVPKRTGDVTFTVSGVSHGTLTYDSGDNHDPDGDSDGTVIVVGKP